MQLWHKTVGGDYYSIELAETRIGFTRHSGTPESFGGNEMPYPRFLRSEKWQRHVSDVFGEQILQSVLAAIKARTG